LEVDRIKVVIDGRGRKHLVSQGEVHTELGVVVIEEGAHTAESHLGHRFTVLDADALDLYEKMPRSGSVIVRKDVGALLVNLCIGAGKTVVDAGSGSAALALLLGNVVGGEGRVITYERNPRFAEIARRNIEAAGLAGVVELRVRDVLQGFDLEQGCAHAVTLDLAEPWRVFDEAWRVLRRGGRIGVYNPYLEQARRSYLMLREKGFSELRTIEVLEREMEFRSQGSRPRTMRAGHTGYLTFARKV